MAQVKGFECDGCKKAVLNNYSDLDMFNGYPKIPNGWVSIRISGDIETKTFCSWHCLYNFAGKQPCSGGSNEV